MDLNFDDFTRKGLYLIFPDSSRLDLTKENIEAVVEKFWNDPAKISPQIKQAAEFQRCHFCPLKRQEDMCDAIRPTMPFLDVVDKYLSFDGVIAVFKGDRDVLYVSSTTMQEALKYVSALSLMYYCRKGRTHWRYYYGINPLMRPKEIAARLYLNIYFLHNGDKEKVREEITALQEEVMVTSKNQVARMNLVCSKDAFMNAFVNTQISTEFLSMDMDKILEKSFEDFAREYKELGV